MKKLMKQSFTKLFVAFLALLLAPNWAVAEDYSVYITKSDGTTIEITSANKDDVLGDGSIEYATFDITFGNALYIKKSISLKQIQIGSESISLQNRVGIDVREGCEVTITEGVKVYSDTEIYGKGKLSITSSGDAISVAAGKNLKIGGETNVTILDLDCTPGTGNCIKVDNGGSLAFEHTKVSMSSSDNIPVVSGVTPTLTNCALSSGGAWTASTLTVLPIMLSGDELSVEDAANNAVLKFDVIDTENDYVAFSGLTTTQSMELTIPSQVEGLDGNLYTVTQLGNGAEPCIEANNQDVTAITAPATITGISTWAFANLPNLATFTITSTCDLEDFDVAEGDDPSFVYMTNPVELIIPASWGTVSTRWAGGNWTGDCVVGVIEVGSEITYTADIVGESEATSGKLDLTFVIAELPDEDNNITRGKAILFKDPGWGYDEDFWPSDGDLVYSNPTNENMIGTLTIPSEVEDGEGTKYDVIGIGGYAFYDNIHEDACPYINSVVIPSSVTTVGMQAFANCPLTSVTFLGEMVSDAFDLDNTEFKAFENVTATLTVPDSWGDVWSDWMGADWTNKEKNTRYPIGIKETSSSDMVWVKNSNVNNLTTDNKVSYDPDNNILIIKEGAQLYDLVINSNENSEYDTSVDDLTIRIDGDAVINFFNIKNETKVNIKGNGGVLTAGKPSDAQYTDYIFKLYNGVALEFIDVEMVVNQSEKTLFYDYSNGSSSIEFNHSSIDVVNIPNLFHGFEDEPIYTNCSIVSPEGVIWENGNYYKDNSKVTSLTIATYYGIIIGKAEDLNIYDEYDGNLIGVEVTSANADDVLGDGKVSYDAASNTLTLADGAALSAICTDYENDESEVIESVDNLIISVEGTVTMGSDNPEEWRPTALDLRKNATIIGTGTLNVSTYNNLLYYYGDLLIDGVTINATNCQTGISGESSSNGNLMFNHVTYSYSYTPDEWNIIYPIVVGDDAPEPVLINCEITNPSPVPTMEFGTIGYYNLDESVTTFTITADASSTITAEVEDGSADDLTVDLELLSANEVAIAGVDGSESATGTVEIPATLNVGGKPMTVTAIADNAFANQTNLTGVTIPKFVTSIGAGAFAGCTSLQTLTIQNPIVPSLGTGAFDANADLTVKYPAAAYDGYNMSSCPR